MNIIHDENTISLEENYGVALGNFDGIHLAHTALIKTLITECAKLEIKSMVYTFNEHPVNILGNKKIKLISTLEKKSKILDKLGVDTLCLRKFDQIYANMSAEKFVKDVLVDKYNVKLVIVGFNYHFGAQGIGDVILLKSLGIQYGFKVIALDAIYCNDEVISSSNIRDKIKNGHMEGTKKLLGNYYSIKGIVEYGNKIGTVIGFPTANIIPIKNYALPKTGVYYTNTNIDGKTYESITNIGVKPTITEDKKVTIETHIFDFSDWLYGKEIEVIFKKFIRGEKKHNDINELKEQIVEDINFVKNLYGGK